MVVCRGVDLVSDPWMELILNSSLCRPQVWWSVILETAKEWEKWLWWRLLPVWICTWFSNEMTGKEKGRKEGCFQFPMTPTSTEWQWYTLARSLLWRCHPRWPPDDLPNSLKVVNGANDKVIIRQMFGLSAGEQTFFFHFILQLKLKFKQHLIRYSRSAFCWFGCQWHWQWGHRVLQVQQSKTGHKNLQFFTICSFLSFL